MFWIACASSYSAGRFLDLDACMTAAIALAVLALASAALLLVSSKRLAFVIGASILLGGCMGFASSALNLSQADECATRDFDAIDLVLLEDSKQGSSAESALARITWPDGANSIVVADFRGSDPLLCGESYRVRGSYRKARWPDDEYLWRNGAIGRFAVREKEAQVKGGVGGFLLRFRARAIEALGGDTEEQALLQALSCGYRRNVSHTSVYSCFQACGLAHLVAVSGAHLIIVTGLFGVLLKALRAPRRVTIVVLIVAMGMYLVLSGMPISAIRAALMSSVGILALFGRRRPSSLNALGLGMYLIVGASPSASVSTSFVLSALSTAGIVLFAPLVQFWLNSISVPIPRFAVDALALTFASGTLSQLYACSVFHQLPLIGPLANVSCAPLFPVLCGIGLVLGVSGALALPMASSLAGIAHLLARLFALMVKALSQMPFSCIPLSIETGQALAISAVLALAIWLMWPSLRLRVLAGGACAVLLVVVIAQACSWGNDEIVMLDVGQGDAFLIKSRGASLLIDTGNRDGQLLDQLARSGTYSLDGVLITHSDDDHCGSIDALERAVKVDTAFVACDMLASAEENNVELVGGLDRLAARTQGLAVGDCLDVGAFTLTVVWPHGFAQDGGNADSLCLIAEYDGDDDGVGDAKALFTGDAESEQLQSMLDEGSFGKVDVLKVGHHGSRASVTSEQLEQLAPSIALIGVGEGNRYGHPSPDVIDALGDAGCAVLRSDIDGQVRCSFRTDGITVLAQ